jgi:DNA polymerase gamma 1
MIAAELREKIFGPCHQEHHSDPHPEKLLQVKSHLSKHGLWNNNRLCQQQEQILITLPQLEGSDVLQHFHRLATRFTTHYKDLCDTFCRRPALPAPIAWSDRPGWTKYLPNGTNFPVQVPDEQFLVLDIETCVKENNQPVLATACGGSGTWYSWSHPVLTDPNEAPADGWFHSLSNFIPMGTSEQPRLIVGHNVAFDRSFLREMYNMKPDATRFMDTMSLHVAISGLTGYQRALSSSFHVGRRKGIDDSILNEIFKLKGQPNPVNWEEYGALNNLKDVYAFYCKKNPDFDPLKKEVRDVFVEGGFNDVRIDFQNLMSYCARDVKATSDVFRQQWPKFLDRFPHPVTLAGMIEMSITYLPVRLSAWDKFMKSSERAFQQSNQEIVSALTKLANQSCRLLHGHAYKKDVWLWDLDWKVQSPRFRKSTEFDGMKERLKKLSQIQKHASPNDRPISPVQVILDSGAFLKKVQPFMPGYPVWYRDFCSRKSDPDWMPGPHNISTQMRTVPKLMRLMWDGFALHHVAEHGWGFLVPILVSKSEVAGHPFPYEEYIRIVKPIGSGQDPWQAIADDDVIRVGDKLVDMSPDSTAQTEWTTDRPEYCPDVNIPGCRFYKLPHKDGAESNVGNPLSREFLRYIEDGRLTASGNEIAGSLLKLNKSVSYWKMNRKRFNDQIVVQCESDNGVILPRVVVAGTVTRRAVEGTWLTASNAYADRVGSELKAMVRAPDGWNFVGADVDSQELWIASVLGDAAFARVHGCTGIGWMTLEGTKAQGTDLHSKTASIVNISRNEAKILNYGRIYGAGKRFAARFLKQSNPSLTEAEAGRKARDIYRQTKGHKSGDQWIGGTESHMFNRLEQIAKGADPATPVLGCRVSRALESEHVRDDFMTSLVNWVVQSSAVDFLHLMLVCMRWLFEVYQIEGRFAISIHDEVRFLVREEDRYKAAYALQITNLLTRAFISAQVGMRDLPQGVAFFSSVDVDTVLRKEPDLDCITPSNPLGLEKGYGISPGESLTIQQIIQKLEQHK